MSLLDALRMIAGSAPDVAVLDLGLPDMDGKDVLCEARAFSKIHQNRGRSRRAEIILTEPGAGYRFADIDKNNGQQPLGQDRSLPKS